MAEVVEVECPNENCAGRTEAHAKECVCEGTGEVPALCRPCADAELVMAGDSGLAPPLHIASMVPCTEEPVDVDVERWTATWHPATRERPGEWAADIHCPVCSEEGVGVDV